MTDQQEVLLREIDRLRRLVKRWREKAYRAEGSRDLWRYRKTGKTK